MSQLARRSWLLGWRSVKPTTKPERLSLKRRAALGRSLRLDELEQRRMLTIVFNTQYGAETLVTSSPFTVKNTPTVHLLLWGSNWGTGAGQSDPAPVISQAKAILNSTYFKGLTEYGSDGLIGTIDSYVDTANAVPAGFNPGLLTGNSLTQAQSELTTVVNANHLPGPGNPASVAAAPIYLIITDPTHSNGTNGGYNSSGTVATKSVNIASVGTDANFQLFGDTFSHEMAETISDPSSGGVVLTEPSTIPSSLLNDSTKAYNNSVNQIQIADGEAEPAGQSHYTYRLGTAEVQPFWSGLFSAFIVPDGNTQRFSLAPIWNTSTVTFSNTYNLTINGDQLANKNDTIIISRDVAGGTQLSLNGEIATFDPVTASFQGTPLQSITVVGGAGNDLVTVDFTNGNPLPAGGLNFSGGAGTNQISAKGDTNYALTNSSLANGFGAAITLSAIQVANLTGGAHGNTFDVSGWTGSGQIDGQGGTDLLLATKNANFTGSASALSAADGLSISVANVEEIDLTGGASNNTFTVQSTSSVSINVAGGGGSDTLSLIGNTFSIINTHDDSADIASGLSDTQVAFSGIVRLECHAGIGGTTFNIEDLTFGPSVFCYGDAYSSVLNISAAVVDSVGLPTYFYGGGGADTLVIPPGSDPTGTNFIVAGSQVTHSAGGSQRAFNFDANVEQISLSGGSGTNIFSVDDLAATNSVTINGNDGNDSVFLGLTDFDGSEPFSDSIKGNVVVHGGAGNNALQVDDTAAVSGRSYELLNGTLKAIGMSGLVTYDSLGPVALLGTAFGDIFNIDGSVTTNLNVSGADGDDLFSWNAANNVLPVTLIGGTGTDTLKVNDANRNEFNYLMYPDEVNGYDPNTGSGEDFHYDQMDSMNVTASADINQFTLFGTSAQLTGQTTLQLGGGNDSVTVNVRDADGNPTVLSNLGIAGGSDGDNLYLVDPATTGTIWTISNPFGASTQDFSVTGGALIGAASDVEGINIYGSSGDDTFNLNQYKAGSALGIAGGDGNDSVNVGNGNLATNITSIAAFTFDGQVGFDSFNLDNSADTNGWFYANSTNSIQAQRITPTAYVVTLGQANTESMTFNAGPSSDNLTLVAVAAGETLTFLGNDGNDVLNVNSPSSVQGPVYFYGGAGTGNAFNNSINSDIADRTVHLDQTSLGAFPGDNFFGPGGALYFYALQSMVITMGSGQDTAYAQPNATATVNIRGGSPTSAPGDTLNLALAGATNYAVTPNHSLPSSGTVTSDNWQTLSYSELRDRADCGRRCPRHRRAGLRQQRPHPNHLRAVQQGCIRCIERRLSPVDQHNDSPAGAIRRDDFELRRGNEYRELYVPGLHRRRSAGRSIHGEDFRYPDRLVWKSAGSGNAIRFFGIQFQGGRTQPFLSQFRRISTFRAAATPP